MASRIARKRAARADAFLDAAMEVVAAEGLDALTIARIAAVKDASIGALYRYFDSKDDVVAALQARALDALLLEMQRVSAKAAPLERVLALLRPFATLAARDPLRHRLLDAVLSAPAPVHAEPRARALEPHLAPALALVEAALADAARAGALDAKVVAGVRTRALLAAIHGADHLRKRDRLEAAAHRHAKVERELLRALLVGFGGTPRGVASALDRAWK